MSSIFSRSAVQKTEAVSLLLVEDVVEPARSVRHLLDATPGVRFQVRAAGSLYEAIEALEKNAVEPQGRIEAVLAVLPLADSTARQALRALREQAPDLPIVVVSGDDGDAFALDMIRGGAQECLTGEALDGAHLVRALDCAIERVLAQQTLLESLDAAESAESVREEFLAKINQEIRSPLNGIVGMSDLLLNTALNEEQAGYVEMLRGCTKSLLALLNDLLDFSKANTARLDLERIDFDFRQMLSEALQCRSRDCVAQGVELACNVAPDVPRVLQGDPGRLRQVINYLARVALQCSDGGEIVIRAEVQDFLRDGGERGGSDEALLHFSISEKNDGLSPEKREWITRTLDRGAPAPASNTREPMGLGLTLAARLVEMMRGRIWFESDPGLESCFHFTVRLGVPAPTMLAPREAEPVRLEGLRVLLVDEHKTSSLILQEMVSGYGMLPDRVAGSQAAFEALEVARQTGQPYALAILSVTAAEGEGMELPARMQQGGLSHSTPLLLLVARGERGDGTRCRQLGIAGYLTKPVLSHDLRAAIAQVLVQYAALAESEAAGFPSPAQFLVTRHTLQKATASHRILVAEQDGVALGVIKLLLDVHGHQFDVVETGGATLEAWRRESYNLIILDVDLPGVSGHDVVAEIRRRESETGGWMPILAITDRNSREERHRNMAAGFDLFLHKPLEASELAEAIATCLLPGEAAARNARTQGQERRERHTALGTDPFAEDTDEESAFDHAALLERLHGDAHAVKQAIESFLIDTPAHIVALREKALARDRAGFLENVQVLRAAASAIEARALLSMLSEIAESIEREGLENAESHSREVESLFARLNTVLLLAHEHGGGSPSGSGMRAY
ncbi:MAG TPA: response regulator [Candidatus Sumerlaeota bacterium]|nr:response regulator [Candidatus Sumerlaeota bacterium]HPS02446.1 response regulator [Candidatus Sumerlaeota bacterium]